MKLAPTEGIIYEKCGTYATVIDYVGTSLEIFISEKYEGLPVTKISENAFEQKNIKSIIIPNSIATIGKNAFHECKSLVSVKMGGVTYIQDYAFYECKALTEILFSDTLTTIGRSAFGFCSSLKSINFPSSLSKIYYGAFNYSACLETDTNGITYVGTWIVKYDNSSTVLNVPEGTKGIANYAFGGCTKLRDIVIPNTINHIGEDAFSGCSNLKSISLPFVGQSASDTGLRHFAEIFGPVYSSNENHKYIPTSLTTVIITGDSAVPDFAFQNCKITNITIGKNVTHIGICAFSMCSNLTVINYGGTIDEWNALEKGDGWEPSTDNYSVVCVDGAIIQQ